MAESIKVSHLTKDFGSGRGVFDVNIDVQQAECFGYLGPNGAGKSTTIRILMGFTKPQKGECYIETINTRENREKIMRNVSYIPGEISLPDELTAMEVIRIQKELKNVVDDTFLDFLVKEFELDLDIKCKDMSLGMKRKLVVICAFMNDPDIIIMDEPTSGLDPQMQDKFIQLIKAEKKRGKTILLSSHIFSEVDSCCDRIAIIKDGEIVSFFTASSLKHKTLKRYLITFKKKQEYATFAGEIVPRLFQIENKNEEKLYLEVVVDDKNVNNFLQIISDYDIVDFKEKKETLEDYFMSFYKEDKEFTGVH